jgi:beta-phosphoglucomutase
MIRDGLPLFPGALEFVLEAASRFQLAIASGSLRAEIEYLLGKAGLLESFPVLASADDCEHSKPSPCVYLTALERLGQMAAFGVEPLEAAQCLAIEDAPLGVKAAHAAGMKCLALAHSRPSSELEHADWIAPGFPVVKFESIERAFGRTPEH